MLWMQMGHLIKDCLLKKDGPSKNVMLATSTVKPTMLAPIGTP